MVGFDGGTSRRFEAAGRRGAGARATARARQVREDHGFEAEAAEGLAAGAGQPADPLGRGFKG